jgi:hypothetical protein
VLDGIKTDVWASAMENPLRQYAGGRLVLADQQRLTVSPEDRIFVNAMSLHGRVMPPESLSSLIDAPHLSGNG